MLKESSWLRATITSAEMAGAAIARRGPTGTALQIDLLSGKQQQAPQPNPALEREGMLLLLGADPKTSQRLLNSQQAGRSPLFCSLF